MRISIADGTMLDMATRCGAKIRRRGLPLCRKGDGTEFQASRAGRTPDLLRRASDTHTGFGLRRRCIMAPPSPRIEEQLARDYARVAADEPFLFLSAGWRGSHRHVNNGADHASRSIEGLPFTGQA